VEIRSVKGFLDDCGAGIMLQLSFSNHFSSFSVHILKIRATFQIYVRDFHFPFHFPVFSCKLSKNLYIFISPIIYISRISVKKIKVIIRINGSCIMSIKVSCTVNILKLI
jgi:hypothetical protein